MNTIERIRHDMLEALKAGQKTRVSTLRMLLAALHNEEIERRRELLPEDVARIIGREIRQRQESITEYHRGGREDLVAREEEELRILKEYQPKMMPEEEIEQYVEEAIREVRAREPRDLGRVMAVLMPRLAGKAEGAVVNRIVREKLAGG